MLEILKKLPLKYFDVIEPNIFQVIKHYPEDEACAMIHSLKLLEKISSERLNSEIVNHFDDNLLMDCMIKGKLKLVELLLESKKFDLSFENNKGENALYYMAYYHLRSEKITNLMIEQHAPVGTKNLATILYHLLRNTHESLLSYEVLTQFLLAYDVNPLKVYMTEYNQEPQCLLDYAESHHSSTCIKAILNMNKISYELLEEKLNTLESSSFPNQFKMHVYNKMTEMEKAKLEILLDDKETEKPNKINKI